MNDDAREETRTAEGKSGGARIRAVLIALIVLLGGLALGLGAALLYLHSGESRAPQAAPTPVQTRDETGTGISIDGTGDQGSGTAGEPEPAARDTEAPEAPAGEAGTPVEPAAEALRSAYGAYLQLLEREQPSIDRYYWQRGYYGWGDLSPEKLSRPVVLADFYGDGIPELLYLTEEQPDMVAGLRIVTWEKGELRTLFSESWDYLVAGGVRYYFFQQKDSKALWAHLSSGDESWTWSYSCFEESGDGSLERRVRLRKDREIDYSSSTYAAVFHFLRDGQEIDEQSYEDALGALEGETETVLMLSAGCGDFAEGFAAREGCPAMSCEEAIAWLRQQLGESGASAVDTGADWSGAYRDFVLSGRYLQEGDPLLGYDENGVRASLRDLDGDGLPELLILNGFNGRDLRARYVFRFEGGEIRFCGALGADCETAAGWPGLFSSLMQSGAYLEDEYRGVYDEVTTQRYWRLRDGGIDSQILEIRGRKGGAETVLFQSEDPLLLTALYAERLPLPEMSPAEIRSQGWDAFVQHMG